VWDQEFNLIKTLIAHSDIVKAFAFKNDGCLISGSHDSTIKVWSKQYDLLKTLNKEVGGHSGFVISLAINSDGLLISGD
jgi:WD40 repeat protein